MNVLLIKDTLSTSYKTYDLSVFGKKTHNDVMTSRALSSIKTDTYSNLFRLRLITLRSVFECNNLMALP